MRNVLWYCGLVWYWNYKVNRLLVWPLFVRRVLKILKRKELSMTDCRLSPEKFKKLPQRKISPHWLTNANAIINIHAYWPFSLFPRVQIQWSSHTVSHAVKVFWGHWNSNGDINLPNSFQNPCMEPCFWLLCGARTEFLPVSRSGA